MLISYRPQESQASAAHCLSSISQESHQRIHGTALLALLAPRDSFKEAFSTLFMEEKKAVGRRQSSPMCLTSERKMRDSSLVISPIHKSNFMGTRGRKSLGGSFAPASQNLLTLTESLRGRYTLSIERGSDSENRKDGPQSD